ncbi:hypothetical protein FTX61_14710 [Nitriliruptoraceae bacterium ZYF776]|nr:hypothetical protein [Profundirhabdus halotolerans]
MAVPRVTATGSARHARGPRTRFRAGRTRRCSRVVAPGLRARAAPHPDVGDHVTRARPAVPLLALLLGLAFLAPALLAPPAEAQTSRTPVMQRDQLTAGQLAAWFRSTPSRVNGYRATVDVRTLAGYYIEEGRAEGVAGDLAFAQAVLETGSFSWPGHGQVRANQNNFAGIGACDGGTCTVATFRNARIGVRAQIQHLRAYADPTVTVARLANPLESPRFHLVTPKGRAPTWEQMGGGNWATDPAYSRKVLDLYAQMRRHAGVGGSSSGSPSGPTAVGYVAGFRDVPTGHTHAGAIAALAEAGITAGCTSDTFCPAGRVTRAQVASFLVRASDRQPRATGAFRDVSGPHATAIDTLAAAGVARGCGPGRFCPNDTVTRAQLASFLQRELGLPSRTPSFRDVPAGAPHAGAIGALAEAGIIRGGTDGRFQPGAPVTRAQMASFLQRAYLTPAS